MVAAEFNGRTVRAGAPTGAHDTEDTPMNRIMLSPKAVTVAAHLRTQRALDAELGACDADIASTFGLKPDSVYRALCELRAMGALSFTRHATCAGGRGRRITLVDSSWVWTALVATGPAAA